MNGNLNRIINACRLFTKTFDYYRLRMWFYGGTIGLFRFPLPVTNKCINLLIFIFKNNLRHFQKKKIDKKEKRFDNPIRTTSQKYTIFKKSPCLHNSRKNIEH